MIAKGLLSFSVFAFLLSMGALLAFRIDAFVISPHDDPAAVTVYAIGNKTFDPMINLLLAVGRVLMPLASSAVGRGPLDEVRVAFLKWSRITAVLVSNPRPQVSRVIFHLNLRSPHALAWVPSGAEPITWLEWAAWGLGLLALLVVAFELGARAWLLRGGTAGSSTPPIRGAS